MAGLSVGLYIQSTQDPAITDGGKDFKWLLFKVYTWNMCSLEVSNRMYPVLVL